MSETRSTAWLLGPSVPLVSQDQPPLTVMRAFGVEGPFRLLEGGQDGAWAAEGLVFKQGSGLLQQWLADVVPELKQDGFRLASPRCSRDGSWSVQGWTASAWIVGAGPTTFTVSTVQAILTAGRAFHAAAGRLGPPPFLAARRDWWARADRAAWGERPVQFHPALSAVAARLTAALEPLSRPQVVHGDMTNNVLFAPGVAPGIIDISPYWRSPEYAEGVVVADALCWHDAPSSLPEEVGVSVSAVARALLFRLATTNERVRGGDHIDLRDEAHRYAIATAAIGL